ncbi:MAG: hypothetical protein KatS3mg049_0499 [Caldilinea sp.]|jgi:hypothetical protein|nr:MAG: hypothetical protein KatS3mg049_0499 [Caldilinea sp.]
MSCPFPLTLTGLTPGTRYDFVNGGVVLCQVYFC